MKNLNVYVANTTAYKLPATHEANHSIHPARKLGPRPKAIRAKLYAPPARGIALESSAKLMAVNSAISPVSAKVSSTPPGPASRMDIPIPMNTPAPIIIPSPIMVIWNRDSSRDSSAGMDCLAGVV